MIAAIRRYLFVMWQPAMYIELKTKAILEAREEITAAFQKELDERTNAYEKSLGYVQLVLTQLNGNQPIPEEHSLFETIEAYQADRFFRRISEDVGAILSGGTPEASSQMLLEYFELQPNGDLVLDNTARQLHRIIKIHANSGFAPNGGEHVYDKLSERVKKVYRKYAMSMWHDQTNISNHSKKDA